MMGLRLVPVVRQTDRLTDLIRNSMLVVVAPLVLADAIVRVTLRYNVNFPKKKKKLKKNPKGKGLFIRWRTRNASRILINP
jgi:hypothetical protein